MHRWMARMAMVVVGSASILCAQSVEVQLPESCAAQGHSRQVLTRVVERLCSPPLSDLEFLRSDLDFKLTRRFTEYSGDISGRTLGALQAAAPLLNREIPMIQALAEALDRLQKSDGHWGADQDLKTEIRGERDMPILWGNGRVLLALAERYRMTRDPKVLAVAKRAGDYAINTRAYFGKPENFQKVGGVLASGYTTCYPSLIDGLAALGQVSGEAKYMDEARFIARLSLQDREFAHHHSHGRLTAYRGMLDIDRDSGTSEFRDAIVAGCKTIREGFMLPTGGVTETFDRTYDRDEGCTIADWIRVNFLLWRATGEAMYLDLVEHVLTNHLQAVQFRNGGFGHRVARRVTDGQRQYLWGGLANRGSDSYWCCSMHCAQILADATRWGVMESKGKFLVTWLSEVASKFRVNDQVVELAVQRMDEPGAWQVRLKTASPLQVVLRLRRPGWAKEFSVNGQAMAGDGGWVEVPVKCEGDAVVNVAIRSDIRTQGVYAENVSEGEPVRLFAGADLFCLSDADVPDGFLPDDQVPEVLYGSLAKDGTIPAIVRQGDTTVRTCLRPMRLRLPGGCRFLIKARPATDEQWAAAGPQFVRQQQPIEVSFACDGKAEIYLNARKIANSAGWGENQRVEVYAPAGENILACKIGSQSSHPALMGLAEIAPGQRVQTHPAGWQAIRSSEDSSLMQAFLSDAKRAFDSTIPLKDLGGFGVAPWKHMNGEFAGTDARWIWPDDDQAAPEKTWLVRTVVTVPTIPNP